MIKAIIVEIRSMNQEIQILITLDSGIKLVSVNSMYQAGMLLRNGRQVPYIYKTSQAKRFESVVDNQLRAVDFGPHMDWLRSTKQFTMTQQYILKSGASRRDCGNFEKLCTDTITRFFVNELGIEDFDDSMFSDLHLYKSTIPGGENEYLLIKISPSKFNMRYDIIPKPAKIWISGCTQDEITAFLPPLPKKLKKKEHYLLAAEKEQADTLIYILQPTPFTPISPTLTLAIYKDIVEAVYSGFGFVYVGVLGEKEAWQTGEWEQIEWLMGEARVDYKGVRVEVIEKQEDLLEWIK